MGSASTSSRSSACARAYSVSATGFHAGSSPLKSTSSSNPAAASRFAAKEAYSKALGTGFRDGLTFHTLSVSNDPLGRPLMICAGRAAEIIEDLDIGSIHLSLSDEIDFAVAFVVLEARNVP